MGKKKLQHFAEMKTFEHVFEPDRDSMLSGYYMKGNWNKEFFNNDHPVVLELGCGKGEYTVGMAGFYPDRNFIGVDVKGARMWRGAKTVAETDMKNVAFLRTKIEFIDSFFGPEEVAEIWLTFSDPQLKDKSGSKRLTGPRFLQKYRQILQPGGVIHLKTDSDFLYGYTLEMIRENRYPLHFSTADLYQTDLSEMSEIERRILHFKTFYEQKFLALNKNIHYLKFSIS